MRPTVANTKKTKSEISGVYENFRSLLTRTLRLPVSPGTDRVTVRAWSPVNSRELIRLIVTFSMMLRTTEGREIVVGSVLKSVEDLICKTALFKSCGASIEMYSCAWRWSKTPCGTSSSVNVGCCAQAPGQEKTKKTVSKAAARHVIPAQFDLVINFSSLTLHATINA